MSQDCVLDANGDCLTHAPGSAGEQEQHNKIVDAVVNEIKKAGRIISEMGMMLIFADEAVAIRNKDRARRGLAPLRPTEAEVEPMIQRIAKVMMEEAKKIEALRDTAPAQTAEAAPSATAN